MTAVRALNLATRVLGTLALLLGLAFWAGWLYGLVPLHMALGALVVLGLWALAVLAARRGAPMGLVVVAALWGLLTLGLGGAQTNLLVGDLHWLVRLLHLVVGLGALGLAARLARLAR